MPESRADRFGDTSLDYMKVEPRDIARDRLETARMLEDVGATHDRRSMLARIRVFQRRLAYLEARVREGNGSEKALSYLRGEAAAIRWALPILKKYRDDKAEERAKEG